MALDAVFLKLQNYAHYFWKGIFTLSKSYGIRQVFLKDTLST